MLPSVPSPVLPSQMHDHPVSHTGGVGLDVGVDVGAAGGGGAGGEPLPPLPPLPDDLLLLLLLDDDDLLLDPPLEDLLDPLDPELLLLLPPVIPAPTLPLLLPFADFDLELLLLLLLLFRVEMTLLLSTL